MGTSSIYKGPKKTILLPDDYSDDNNPNDVFDTLSDEKSNEQPQEQPTMTWQSAKSRVTKSVGSDTRAVRNAMSSYTKALGGHRNAAKQSVQARKTTANIISFFSGSPSEIKHRLESEGISFEGKTTKEIFFEIRDLLAPIPNTLEGSYVNKAVTDTISELMKDSNLETEQIDNLLNQELLEKLVCGTVKNYIYQKFISQATAGILKKGNSITDIHRFEKKAKSWIEGIVKSVIPKMLHSGVNPRDIDNKVKAIYEGCYKIMENFK